ncbi:MAG: alpha/beta hydrolase [Verrucomicrobia bacterium]|nr:alpha/beta hydrolase [Verrucomicrobiota bacterium]
MPSASIAGPSGLLEGRFHRAASPAAPIALVLHPNPKFGGTMNTLVVYSLFTTFQDAGFSVLRFNFRGVGRSTGEFSGGAGELADAQAAWAWLCAECPQAGAKWVAGFSFGSWIGLQLLFKQGGVDGFVAVAPPANNLDFSFVTEWRTPGLIVHGSDDSLVPEAVVKDLVARPFAPSVAVDFVSVPGASHFFDTGQEELVRVVRERITRID